MGRARSLTFRLSLHGAAVVCGLGAAAATAEAASPLVTEFAIPTPSAAPLSITRGPDGNLWFTEFGADRIGRITPSGVITEFPLPAGFDGPGRITAGPDGALWFTEHLGGTKIGRIAVDGTVTVFTVPTPGAGVFGIAAGSDGNLWFTEQSAIQVGRITPSGVVTEFPVVFPPHGITLGPDGNIWFVEGRSDFSGSVGILGRALPDGTIQHFFNPIAHGLEVATGPDGNLWVKLVHFDGGPHPPPPTFSVIRCSLQGGCNLPGFELGSTGGGEMTRAPDGHLWIAALGRLSQTGALTRIPLGNSGITVGPDGNLWFTGGNTIGRRIFPNHAAVAVYRTTTGEWFIQRPSDSGLTLVGWGAPVLGDTPVPADYDGDGLTDIAVYRRSTAEWFIRRSTDLGLTLIAWGSSFLADVPVPGDYDADGVADVAVYRGLTGEWFIRRSSDGGLTQVGWGSPPLGDVPVPARY
jgi:streptogramin lyase